MKADTVKLKTAGEKPLVTTHRTEYHWLNSLSSVKQKINCSSV